MTECEYALQHIRPVHLNRGRNAHIWLCLACNKQLGGPKLRDEEREALAEFFKANLGGQPPRKQAARAAKENEVKLEVAMIVGPETKQWLTDMTKIVERMERAAGGKPAAPTADTEDDEDELDVKPAKTKKAAAAFDDGEEEDAEAIEAADEDDEELAPKKTKGKKAAADFDEDEEETEEEDEETEAPAKKTKAKKVTLDDVNDACKAKVQALIKSGQPGPESRKAVQKILKKKFEVTSVADLKPEQYAAVVKAMA